MKAYWRHILFFAFVLAFLITAPLVVLHTAGYRYQFGINQIVKTGVLSISTVPRGATIFIDDIAHNDKTPTVIDTISPGQHTIRLAREGFSSWTKTLDVHSNETTFASDVIMFFDDSLEVSSASLPDVEKLDLVDATTVDGRNVVLQNLSDRSVLSFIDEDNVADIIAYLPAGDYQFQQSHESTLTLVDQNRDRIILVNPSEDQPILLNAHAKSWQWREDEPQLVFSDGFDLQVFNTQSKVQETVTRLSEPVRQLAWYPDGHVVVYATDSSVYALELDRRGEQNQYILAQMAVESFSVDEKGERLFVQGTKDNVRGVFERKLMR